MDFLQHQTGLQQMTFWVYNDGFDREKDPIVMFMGHIGVPTKKLVQGNECFIFYFCVLGSVSYRKICCLRVVLVFWGGACYQIIASHAFAEKHFTNLTRWLDSQRV